MKLLDWNLIQNNNVASPPPHNIILFEIDLNVKFPLLRLLQFLSNWNLLINLVLETKVIVIYQNIYHSKMFLITTNKELQTIFELIKYVDIKWKGGDEKKK